MYDQGNNRYDEVWRLFKTAPGSMLLFMRA